MIVEFRAMLVTSYPQVVPAAMIGIQVQLDRINDRTDGHFRRRTLTGRRNDGRQGLVQKKFADTPCSAVARMEGPPLRGPVIRGGGAV